MINAGIALDMDGTVADSARENYYRIVETWADLHDGKQFPLPYEVVLRDIRPHILMIEDYFSAIFAVLDNDGVVPQDLPGLSKSYRRDDARVHREKFYQRRDVKKRNDMAGWIAEQPLYQGVPGMLKQLNEMGIMGIGTWVVSSKKAKDIRDMWEFNNLPMPEGIYDQDHGERPDQLRAFQEDTKIPTQRIIVYDDAAMNLAVARSLGMHAVAAPQGYELPDRISGYRQALPSQFPGLVGELLDI